MSQSVEHKVVGSGGAEGDAALADGRGPACYNYKPSETQDGSGQVGSGRVKLGKVRLGRVE